MTLNLTITCAVQVPEQDTADMDEKQRSHYAQMASQLAQDRVADWFRGHAARIAATANLDAPQPQS